jgi:hypothetical protein
LISGVSEKLISRDFQLSAINAVSSLEKFGISNLDYQNSNSALIIKSVEIQKLANKAHICSSTQDIHVRSPSVFQIVQENPLAKRSPQ